MAVPDLLQRRRFQIVGGAVVVVAILIVILVTQGTDDDHYNDVASGRRHRSARFRPARDGATLERKPRPPSGGDLRPSAPA